MFLALGPHIRRGHRAGAIERDLDDISATVSALMGLTMPYALDGRVMHELFLPDFDFSPVANAGIEELGVSVATVNLEGEPCSVFLPGETVGLETTVHNQGTGEVCIFQGEIEIAVTCHIGKSYVEGPLCLAPDEWITETDYVVIPEITPAGEWPLLVEVRGLDDVGDVIYGIGLTSVVVQMPGRRPEWRRPGWERPRRPAVTAPARSICGREHDWQPAGTALAARPSRP
jgi:hypothetical protein